MASVGLKVVEVFILLFICVGTFLGNAILIVLVVKVRDLQTRGNVFILNLVFADLLVALFNIPIIIVTVIAEDWILGDDFCKLSAFITLVTFVASCMALTMISINRYHAIVHWTSYTNTYTPRKCVMYIAIVWAITIGLSMPPFFGWGEFGFEKSQHYCIVQWSESKSYTMFMIAACLFGPIGIMTYCYVKIFKYHKVSRRTIRRTGECVESREHSSSFHLKRKNTSSTRTVPTRSRGKQLTRTIVMLIVVFTLCWSPYAIIVVVKDIIGTHVTQYVDFGSLVLGCLNSFLNVFVYNATNKRIREGYKKLLCCKRVSV